MLTKSNKVFIATSLDGFISDPTGGIDWLDSIPEINDVDSGFADFISGVDALLMGRKTFEKVCSFDVDWPFTLPVYVLTSQENYQAPKHASKIKILSGDISSVLNHIHSKGHHGLYLDGGNLIQSFLKRDLIDEMIITVIPVLLGDGIRLFGDLENRLLFNCISSKIFCKAIVQNHFVRKR